MSANEEQSFQGVKLADKLIANSKFQLLRVRMKKSFRFKTLYTGELWSPVKKKN